MEFLIQDDQSEQLQVMRGIICSKHHKTVRNDSEDEGGRREAWAVFNHDDDDDVRGRIIRPHL